MQVIITNGPAISVCDDISADEIIWRDPTPEELELLNRPAIDITAILAEDYNEILADLLAMWDD